MDTGDNVTLTGLMISMIYPGPPNDESIEDGDTPETYFVLKPDTSINCATDPPQFGSKKLVQLVVQAGNYKKYQSGRRESYRRGYAFICRNWAPPYAFND